MRGIIVEVWGEGIAKLVEEVTDEKALPKEDRKRKEVESASKKSDRAKILKLADKTSNLRAITASPPSVKRGGSNMWRESATVRSSPFVIRKPL